jgi:hypothetical protein
VIPINTWKLRNNAYEALSFVILLVFLYAGRNELSHIINLPDPLTGDMIPFGMAGLGGLILNRFFIYRRDKHHAPAGDVTALREMCTLAIDSLTRLVQTSESLNLHLSAANRDLKYGFTDPTPPYAKEEVIT